MELHLHGPILIPDRGQRDALLLNSQNLHVASWDKNQHRTWESLLYCVTKERRLKWEKFSNLKLKTEAKSIYNFKLSNCNYKYTQIVNHTNHQEILQKLIHIMCHFTRWMTERLMSTTECWGEKKPVNLYNSQRSGINQK